MGDTPVPIPNTTVKTHTADGTSLETVRESRWPPEQKKCSAVGGRKGRDMESRRTLKTAYTIILQSMNFRL